MKILQKTIIYHDFFQWIYNIPNNKKVQNQSIRRLE